MDCKIIGNYKIMPCTAYRYNGINYSESAIAKEFYNSCPSGYGVEETRAFDLLSLQYVTVSMRYIKLF